MGFIGTMIAWICAAGVAFVLAVGAAHNLALTEDFAAMGVAVPAADRWSSTLSSIPSSWLLWPVIAGGFAIAFCVASVAKVVVRPLARLAYTIAGAVTLLAIHKIIPIAISAYDGMPGTESAIGLLLQMGAGATGGAFFEIFRPRRAD